MKSGNAYFKTEWRVRRHLQDIHTSLQYQCTICTHTYQQANMRHGCRATDRNFVLFHPESGDKGPSAQKRLENFVRNVVPFAWRKVNKETVPRDQITVQPSRTFTMRCILQTGTKNSSVNEEGQGQGSSAHSPVPIGEEPLVELRAAPPVFSPPVKI